MLMTLPSHIRRLLAPLLLFFLMLVASLAPLSGAQAQGLSPEWVPKSPTLRRTADRSSDSLHTPRVQVQLLAHAPQGVQPGAPLQLALHILHEPGWHTYWRNPGEAGQATTLDWSLPTGITVGDIQWPAPITLRTLDTVSYGYEGSVVLTVPARVDAAVQPDADGMIGIALHAQWLACRVECIPEQAHLRLRIPAHASHGPHAALFEQARRALPQSPSPAVQAHAHVQETASAAAVQLRISGLPAHWQGQALGLFPELADTFAPAAPSGTDGSIQTPPLQGMTTDIPAWSQSWDAGVWQALLPLTDWRESSPQQLGFVLRGPSDAAVADGARVLHITAPLQGRWSTQESATLPAGLADALQAAQSSGDAAPVQAQSPEVPTGTFGLSALLMAVVGGLLGGAILNLMPCVFPVLAIKLLGFARHGADSRLQRRCGLAYAAGVVLSFVALGALLLALRAAGQQLGWGFQLQNPLLVAALAALFTLIALNLAGVFEVAQIAPDALSRLHARKPVLDAFMSGVVAVLVASPCTAPFMGASLGFAVQMPAAQALAVFASLGLGMALPYVAATWWPTLIGRLPRPGAWMDTLRRGLSFPMWATVVWLVWVLGQQVGVDGAALLLTLLLMLSALVWALTLRGRARAVLVALLLALSAWLALTWGDLLTTSKSPPAQMASPTPAAGLPPGAAPQWQDWSAHTQQRWLEQGRIVFVDYTAAWCITCQYNKRTVLADREVLRSFAEHDVVMLRADWTRRDPDITQALSGLGRSGVPVYVLHAPGQNPRLLPELPSARDITQAVAQIAATSEPGRGPS